MILVNKIYNCKQYILRLFYFNSISTFMGYLMPKPSLEKNSSGAIQPIGRGIRGFISFPRVLVHM